MNGVAAIQLEKLNRLLDAVHGRNPFYTRKWRDAGLNHEALSSIEDFSSFPFTTRDELVADQNAAPPLGTNLTAPFQDYKRVHRSSGTTRAPVLWADTTRSWEWVVNCSRSLYALAGIQPNDWIFFPTPLGMSSGGWILREGAASHGCCCLNAPNAEPTEQLRWIKDFPVSVIVGKPTALLQLAHAARKFGTAGSFTIKKLILTGQPSRSHLRSQLEDLWNAECFDRYGLTEAGPVACECIGHAGGMHLLENEFIAEVIHEATMQPVHDGEFGELVLTSLGRIDRPIVRYRTGDVVRLIREHRCLCGKNGAFLEGDVVRLSSPKHVSNAVLESTLS